MSALTIVFLVAVNVGVIYLLMAAPLGRRTVRLTARIGAPRAKLWQALWPLGAESGWSGSLVFARPLPDGGALLSLSWQGRDGCPIERRAAFEEVVAERSFVMRFVDDTSLDPAFWADYRERVDMSDEPGGTRVVLTRTDAYRGLAHLIFRYFAARRELHKLKVWAETGLYRRGGLFEHPVTQFGFAVVSALILWPFFGLTRAGFVFAAILTSVVALHELGHMAAFRLMGHRHVRMIFIPLLGGIAIGGRPYDSRFEVAFVALMGAGFSAFLVPIAIVASHHLAADGLFYASSLLAGLGGCAALFNLANLVPVWKFDGGQVLRQICPNPLALTLASFALLSVFLWVGHLAGFSKPALVAAGGVFALLSLMTSNSGVKPRRELRPITALDRLAMTGALLAVFAIHAVGVVWAAGRLL